MATIGFLKKKCNNGEREAFAINAMKSTARDISVTTSNFRFCWPPKTKAERNENLMRRAITVTLWKEMDSQFP